MATGALIGALRVTLGLDTAEFEAGAGKAQRAAQKVERDVTSSFSKIGGAGAVLETAMRGLVAGFAIEGISQAISAGLDYASSLGEVAQQAGVSTKTLQEYRYVATQVGVSQQEMDAALASLTVTIGKADAGAKSQSAAFAALGVSTRDANDHLKTTDDVLPELIAAFSRIEDPARRAQIEMDLFGQAGQKLDTLLSGGVDQINALRDAAERLGVVLSNEQIQKADDTADKLAAVKTVLQARIAGAVADNATAILDLAGALGTLADKAGQVSRAYAGLQRIGANEGTAGVLKSFFGTGADQLQASTSEGYANLKIADFKQAARRWQAQRKLGYMPPDHGQSVIDAKAAMDRAVAGYRADQARAATTAARPTTASPHVAHPEKGSSARGGRSDADDASRRAEEMARNRERAERDIARATDEQRGLQQQLTTDLRTRADLEHSRIANDQAQAASEIAARENKGELTKAEADQLRALESRNAEIRHTIVNWQLDDALSREELDLRRADLDIAQDALRGQEQMARTDAERRAIQLRLLEIAYERERAELEAVLAAHETSDAEKAIARKKLDALAAGKKEDVAAVLRDTAGPLGKYLDGLPRSAAEMTEAFQRVEADGIGSVIDGLAEAATGARSLGDVFTNVADDIVRQLARIALQKALLGPLTSLLGLGGGSSFDVGGILGPASIDTSLAKLPGFATGGSFRVGGAPGIDKNLIMFRASQGEMVDVRRPGQQAANDRGPAIVQIHVGEGEMFEPRVQSISGNVTVQTLRTKAVQDAKAAARSLIR